MNEETITLMLIGEFCEKDGPVVRHLYAIDENGQTQVYPEDFWAPETKDHLQQFMMRAMSGDHVYPEKADAQLERRSCEVLMDRIRWTNNNLLVAYVTSVTLFDVYARGYARTTCVAYLSSDEHKVFTISHWLALELKEMTTMLYNASYDRHCAEIVHVVTALRNVKDHFLRNEADGTPLPTGLTDRHRNGYASELEVLSARVFRCIPKMNPAQRIQRRTALRGPSAYASDDASTGESFESALVRLRSSSVSRLADSFALSLNTDPTSPLVVSDEEAVNVVNNLITMKGAGVLRPLEEICGTTFDAVRDMIGKTMWSFAQDTVFLLENMTQLMQPLRMLLTERIGIAIASHWPSHCADPHQARGCPSVIKQETSTGFHAAEQNSFFLKIGDFLAVDPYQRRDPPATNVADHTEFTSLSAGDLFKSLQRFGSKSALALIYHALACRPIIVCGEDEEDVVAAMRLASTFVPGILQSRKDRFGIGLLPFQPLKRVRVTYDHLERFSVIGCHTSSILEPVKEDKHRLQPFLPSAFVWHIHTTSTMPPQARKGVAQCRTITVYGSEYGALQKLSPTPAQTAERVHYVDPLDKNASLLQSTQGQGLLAEVHDLLAIKCTRHHEDEALCNFLRLTLKRIFLDYASMAACVLHSQIEDIHKLPYLHMSGQLNASTMTSPHLSAPSRKATANSSFGSVPPGAFPAIPLANPSMTSLPGAWNGGAVYVAHRVPFVLTEHDVKRVLKTQHGYAAIHADDAHIVTNMLQRMVTLCAEYEPTLHASVS